MNTAQRRATAALWSIQGVGPVTLEEIPRKVGAPVGELLERPLATWAGLVEWRGAAAQQVAALSSLAQRADWLEERCRQLSTQIAFIGDPAWPDRLDELSDAPPLLFLQGPGAYAPRRRRLAIVGSRSAPPHLRDKLQDIAREAAANGLGIVSGAAEGVDESAHLGHWRCAPRRGPSWAARSIRSTAGGAASCTPSAARAAACFPRCLRERART